MNIDQLKERALAEIEQIKNSEQLKAFQEKYLDKKSGELMNVLRGLKDLAEDVRPKVGQMANALKVDLEKIVGEKMVELGGVMLEDSGEKVIDPTISVDRYKLGNLHPTTQLIRDLESLFTSLGFMVLDGPEVESDFFNFESLNIPSWHPAREMQDTFYVESENKDKVVLRTHTSSVQVRAMLKYGAPLRVVSAGRVFRNEATDARHEHTFYQMEGVLIDENVTFANLKALLEEVAVRVFGEGTQIRLRPKYYPFVEPGVNGEVTCFLCHGEGCKVCKQSGWLEIFGAGMIHPNVLKAGGVDPKKYSGFAFGFGVSRIIMLRYGIDDVRLLQSADLRFLKQF